MKKSKIILLIILVLLSFTACNNSKVDKAVEQGKESLKNHEYNKALVYFEIAESEGSKDTEIKDLIIILESYNQSLNLFQKEEFENAKKEISKIKIDYSKYPINKDIKKLNKTITEKIDFNDGFNKEIENIKKLHTQGSFDYCNEKIVLLRKEELNLNQTEILSNIEKQVKNSEANAAEKAKTIEESNKLKEKQEKNQSNKTKLIKIKQKNEYLEKNALNEIREEEIYSSNQAATPLAIEAYELWDGFLNEIWGVLKNNLPKNEMDKLTKEQIQWIKDKEKKQEQKYNEGYPTSVAVSYTVEDTKERCKELINIYME